MTKATGLAIRLGLALLVSGTPVPGGAGEVLVGMAANLAAAAEPLAERFESATGHRMRVSLGSSGALYAQVKNGAPFQLLISADAERPRRLEEEGEAVPGSRFTYGWGRLVLWSSAPASLDPGPETLAEGDFRHLAIADPRTAPYGLAARDVLHSLGLAERLEHRLVRGQSVGQAFQFVASGNAELGLVGMSQVVSRPQSSYWIVPEHLYAPIEQQAVLLQPGRESEAARALLEFLLSDEARGVLQDLGYRLPEP